MSGFEQEVTEKSSGGQSWSRTLGGQVDPVEMTDASRSEWAKPRSVIMPREALIPAGRPWRPAYPSAATNAPGPFSCHLARSPYWGIDPRLDMKPLQGLRGRGWSRNPGCAARPWALLGNAVGVGSSVALFRHAALRHFCGVVLLALEPQRGSRTQPGVAQRTPGTMPAGVPQP